MIQTHYYNLRKHNKNINTCIFKREGDLNAIVPLVVFNTYCFRIKNIIENNIKHNINLPLNISLLEIGVNQVYLITDFIKTQVHPVHSAQ